MILTNQSVIKTINRPATRLAILFSLVILICVATVWSQYRSVLSSAAQSEIQHRLFSTDKQVAFLSMEENSFLQTNYPAFQKIVQGNKGSDAQRKVRWVKMLEAAKTQLGIAEMSFDVYPYQAVVSDRQDLKVQVGTETIILQLSLLHDGKLADLMTYLEENAPNSFAVTALDIERMDESAEKAGNNPDVARLKAELTIKWYLIEVAGEGDALTS